MSWQGLIDTVKYGRQLAEEFAASVPEACPECGEPVKSSSSGVLYCPTGDWRDDQLV